MKVSGHRESGGTGLRDYRMDRINKCLITIYGIKGWAGLLGDNV